MTLSRCFKNWSEFFSKILEEMLKSKTSLLACVLQLYLPPPKSIFFRIGGLMQIVEANTPQQQSKQLKLAGYPGTWYPLRSLRSLDDLDLRRCSWSDEVSASHACDGASAHPTVQMHRRHAHLKATTTVRTRGGASRKIFARGRDSPGPDPGTENPLS